MPKLISSRPLSLAEIKNEIEKIKTKEKKLSLRAEKVLEYINEVSPPNLEKSQKLAKELEALDIPRLKEAQIKKIVDFLPKNPDELRAVLQSWSMLLPPEAMDKILSKVAEFLK